MILVQCHESFFTRPRNHRHVCYYDTLRSCLGSPVIHIVQTV
jgi:hypothetical protein